MYEFAPTRVGLALGAWWLALSLCPALAAEQPTHTPARPPVSASKVAGPAKKPAVNQHLAQWMENHRALPMDQQQRALESEPGFDQLRPEVQQRMREKLTQLNSMPPEQRQRLIARNEAMEQLAPAQRQQVRGAMQQLGSLPEERRRLVARIFRESRSLPDGQRQQYLGSLQIQNQLNEQERGTLNNLVSIAPYLPAPRQPAPPLQ